MDLHPDPTDPEAPRGAVPAPADVTAMLRGVMDPELKASIVDLGMVRDVVVGPDGRVEVAVALTTAGCPLRAQIQRDVEAKVRGLPGVTDVRVRYGEMTVDEKRELMAKARWNAREQAPPTEVPATTRVLAVASGKGGVGKSSVTVNLAVALAARGFQVGVLDADVWGFSVPRLLGVSERLRGTDGKIEPNEVPVDGPGALRVVSMGFLVDEEDTALMWRGLILAKAVEQFLTDVRWGDLDYLLVDMPPGTGDVQMALARLLPQAEMLVVTTPAHNAQKVAMRVADMARRSYMKVTGVIENMSTYVAPDGSHHAIFGAGGGEAFAQEIGVPLVASIPIEPLVAASGDEGAPVVRDHPETPAAQAFAAAAAAIATELLPPVEMAGCTARMLAVLQGASPAAASPPAAPTPDA